MKKFRKGLSVLITLAMLIMLLPQTVLGADTTIADINTLASSTNCAFSSSWSTARNNTVRTDLNNEMKPVFTGHSGNYSALINISDNTNIYDLRNSGLANLPASTYTVSFWACGTVPASWRVILVGPYGSGYSTTESGKTVATGNTENGWKEYKGTFTLTAAANCVHAIEIKNYTGFTANFAIDDFSVKDANNVEYIVDGGFENSVKPLIDTANELATTSNLSFSSSWSTAKNNSVLDLSNIMRPIEMANTGKYSAWIKTDANSTYDLKNVGLNTLPAGTYTLKFWAVGTVPASWRIRLIGPYGGSFSSTESGKTVATGNVNGEWKEYKGTFTLTEATNCGVAIEVYQIAANFVVDDISLKDASNTEYITDGSFENSTKPAIITANELAKTSTLEFADCWSTARNNGVRTDLGGVMKPIAMGHTGNNSAWINTTADSNIYDLRNGGLLSLPASTYTIKFWALGTVPSSWRIRLVGPYGSGASTTEAGKTVPTGKTEGDWKEYQGTFTLTSAATYGVAIEINSMAANFVVDDFSVKDANDTEYVIDGSFEGYKNNTITEANTAAESSKLAFSSSWSTARNNGVRNDLGSIMIPINVAYSGNYSAWINTTADNNIYDLRNSGLASLPVGTYTIKFWALGTVPASWRIRLVGPYGGCYSTTESGKTVATGKAKGGWKEYAGTFTLTNEASCIDAFEFNSIAANFAVDEFSVKDANGKEYVVDGGFENSAIAVVDDTIADANKDGEKTDFVLGKEWFTSGDRNNRFIKATSVAHSGNYAALVDYTGASSGNYIMLKNSGAPENLAAGTYVLTFWGLNIESYKDWRFRIGTTDARNLTATGETEKGWKKYQISFDVAETGLAYLLQFYSSGNQRFNYAIDDMSLKLSGSDTELLADGGFEGAVGLQKDLIHPYAYAVQAGGAVNLSWTNPDVKNISEIKVLVNDTPYTFTADKNASAFNECLVTGLTNGTEYTFKIQATMNGLSNESVVKATPAVSSSIKNLSGWNIVTGAETATTYNNANAYIDSTNGILVAEGNIIKDANAVAKIKIGQNGTAQTLNSIKTYKLEFLAKLEDVDSMYLEISSESGDVKATDFITKNTSSDWQGFEYTIEPLDVFEEYDYTISIVIDGLKGKVSFDEMYLNEIDEFTYEDITGNLFENPNFGEASLADYLVYEPVFDLMNGTTVAQGNLSNIVAGNIRVSAKAKNNKMGDNFNVMVLAGLYDDAELVDVKIISSGIVPQTSDKLAPEVYSGIIEVPELTGGDYSIKVFYWDGLSLQAPLGEAYRLN